MDQSLVARLERLATLRGTDVATMLARMAEALARGDWSSIELGPLTRAATGIAAGLPSRPDRDLVSDSLAEKYGFRG